MNSAQKVTQKQYRKVTKCTACWPSSTPRCAQACACLAVSWALRPCRGRGPRPCRRRRKPCRGHCQRRVVGAASAVSWAQAPCRSTLCRAPGCRVVGLLRTVLQYNALPQQPFGHNTLRCIVIHSPQPPAASVTIH